MGTRPQVIDWTVEVRWTKEQQYRTVYYSVLLFAAIIALFQIHISLPEHIYGVCRVLTIILVALLATVGVVQQWHLFAALQHYRKGHRVYRRRTRLLGVSLLTMKGLIGATLYTGVFSLVTLLSAASALIVVVFDR